VRVNWVSCRTDVIRSQALGRREIEQKRWKASRGVGDVAWIGRWE